MNMCIYENKLKGVLFVDVVINELRSAKFVSKSYRHLLLFLSITIAARINTLDIIIWLKKFNSFSRIPDD